MSWINAGQFQITDRNGRRYVFRRNNRGNTEINIPKTVVTKGQAKRWLKNNPDKVRNPTKFRPKKAVAVPGLKSWEYISPGGKKYIKFVNKEGKEYLRPAPGAEPVYVANMAGIFPKFTCNTLSSTLKQRQVIGKGRQGVVFKASRYTNGRMPFAIKVAPRDLRSDRAKEDQPAQVEFKIHKAAMDVAPDGVVAVYQLLECPNFVKPDEIDMKNVQSTANYDKSKQTLILMEYCPDGSLKKWMETSALSDASLRSVIARIVTTLQKIKGKYPFFNHNDLHLENVFMSKRGPLIGDFGWARLEKDGTNPAVNKSSGTQTAEVWGVGPKTDTRYDHHFILNELQNWLSRHGGAAKYPQTMKFLNMAVPVGYRGMSDTHISEWRLKYEDPCPGLPSLTKIASDPYIRGKKLITSPNLQAALIRLRKKKTSPAKKVAVAKKTYTNAELITLSAANFIKLSPSTRERAKKLRAAAMVKPTAKVVVGPVVTKKNNKPAPKPKVVPKEILKTAKFNKLIEKIWKAQGGPSNESFYNSWNRARTKAFNYVANKLAKNQPPFTPSPPKNAKKELVPSPPSPPKKAAKKLVPSPPSPPKKATFNYKISPKSGRTKIRAPNTGRYVYANGSTISLEYLKSLATMMGVNIKGLRSKADIAKKIFTR